MKRPDGHDRGSLVLRAADCAERVLPFFEEKYPEDNRPRKALEAGRAWARGEIGMCEVRAAAFAAHAAARETDHAAARAAARAAGHAAATAHVAGHARHAAAYAVTAANCDRAQKQITGTTPGRTIHGLILPDEHDDTPRHQPATSGRQPGQTH